MENISTTAENTPLGFGSPTKMWKDLTLDEKVERMRTEVKYLRNRVNSLVDENYSLRRKIAKHTHVDGKVVVEMNEYSESSGLVGQYDSVNDPNNVYF